MSSDGAFDFCGETLLQLHHASATRGGVPGQHRVTYTSSHPNSVHPGPSESRTIDIMASITRSLRIGSPKILRCSWRHAGYPSSMSRARNRSITNATKPDYIPSLLSVPRVAAKPGGWHPTLVHSSGEVKWSVIRLQPDGGEVPIHYHNKVWDYFMPIEGEAVIETETKDGAKQDYEMKAGSFLAVGPGDVHRVRNVSKDKEFVFFIAQAPRQLYDFIAR